MIFNRASALIWLPLTLIFGGCQTISVPDMPIESSDLVSKISAVDTEGFLNADSALPLNVLWWEGFEDPVLTQLVQDALSENRDLLVAKRNIEIAKAQLSRTELTRSYSTSAGTSAEIGRAARPNQDVNLSVSGNLGASWEIDAFGRIDAAIRAAELSVDAQEQARRDIAVMVASETALAYSDLRGAQRQISLTKANADVQLQSLDLVQALLENGRATELDLNRAEAQYRTTLSNIPRLTASIDGAIARLSALSGVSASSPQDSLMALLRDPSDIPELQSGLNAASPAQLLRRRPDIRQAEIEMARRLELSKIERARLFPVVTFNADISALFNGTNRLDQLSSFGFGIGPSVQWEGPDLRRVRADIDISDAETRRAYAQYEAVVLNALADVESALSNSRNELSRRDDLVRAVDAARAALELARLRYEEGLDDFLDVLDSQRTLLDTEARLAESRIQTARLAILTYRELGGIEF